MTTTELETLLGYLNEQRQHVLGILTDLDDEALRRPVLPSGWSCLGLVAHLTEDVERFWFGAVLGAAPEVLDPNADGWRVRPDVPAEVVFAAYRRAIEDADAVLATVRPQDAPAWWPTDLFGNWRLTDVRSVVLHAITETACHAGHLDAVRELIDGRRWLVFDETGVPTEGVALADH